MDMLSYLLGRKGSGGGGGGGGGGTAAKQINFIDYDGTILHAYSKDEFNALSDLPENPTHEGLTAQGWNWTKAQISTQLTAMPDAPVWIGQMYITSDGTTQIDLTLEAPYLSPYLVLAVNGTVDVDWGDGSTHDTVTGTSLSTEKLQQHVYAAGGSYTIKISVTSGSFAFYSGSSSYVGLFRQSELSNNGRKSTLYSGQVTAIRIGSNTSIGTNAFVYCTSLQSVTIPSAVTSIGNNAFSNCFAFQSVTIPSDVTSIGSSMFSNDCALQSVAIPSGVTSLSNYAFGNCYALQSVTIPSGVTSIGSSAFNYCGTLQSVAIPSGVTSISNYTFSNCYAIQSMTIPSAVTSLGSSAFSSCYALQSVAIPSGVTSIGSSAFSGCYAIQSATIPSGVTQIESSTFATTYSLTDLHFTRSSPPTVANSNAFQSLNPLCVIYVPTGKLNDYKTAANYPNPNTYTYVEE